jgi:vesicular inhibitory amino acid transporter
MTTGVCVITAILLPGFGKVMAFLGSFSAFLICIILPVRLPLFQSIHGERNADSQLLFYLRLAPTMLPATANRASTRVVHWILVVISVGLMAAGTGWAFIPGSGHGGLDDGR